MANLTALFNSKYEFLCYMRKYARQYNDELILVDTLDLIVENSNFKKRTLVNIIQELVEDGFIRKSKIKPLKYCFTPDGLDKFDKLQSILNNE